MMHWSFPYIPNGKTISQNWCEAARVFSSDRLDERVSPVCVTLDALLYFTSVEFWFPHPQNTHSSSTYLMQSLRGLNENRDGTLTYPQSETKKLVVWLSCIIFSLLPPSLGITDEHFFQVIQQLIYYKTLTAGISPVNVCQATSKLIWGSRQRASGGCLESPVCTM